MAGLKRTNNKLVLATVYKQPKPYIIYYGMLQYSGLTDYSVFDIIVAADTTPEEVAKARSCGTKIFQYISFGSRFNTENFITDFKSKVSGYASNQLADGIFLDECEVGYWGNYYDNDEHACIFEAALKEVCDYCNTLGLETIVNGVSAYAKYGTYFLWESFAGYWNSNRITWNGSGHGNRIKNTDGTVYYEYPFSDWTLEGSLRIQNGSVVGGQKGVMSISIDMSTLIRTTEQLETYPWVYFEWFGSGADDSSLEIYAFVGNGWPYSKDTWEELPKLWKGEPESWNGINKDYRYLRLELHFKGADKLKMTSCFIAYDYVYPYYDMGASNGIADTNHRYWNYNLSQADYLLEQKAKVLCHCYGKPTDKKRMGYTFTAHKIFGFDAWDYTHPLHQIIRYTDIIDDPFGALLNRTKTGDGKYHGVFTGCEADIDLRNNTYLLNRNEPEYWFDRGLEKFEEVSKVYENERSFTPHTFMLQAEIEEGEPIPGIREGWYVVNVIPPNYQYDAGTGQKDTSITYYNTVQYYPILDDSLNIRKAYVYDDIFYFYYGFKFKGAVDFLAEKPNRYYIYIGNEELDYGYQGEWFKAPMKAQFMIYNQSLFKWDKSAKDQSDYKNFHYIGNAFLSYEFSEGKTMLTYTLKKSVLGEVNTKTMRFFFVLEETGKNYVSLIPNTGVNSLVNPVEFPNSIRYVQRRYNLFSPHGYYLSEEIPLDGETKGAAVLCTASTLDRTWVNLYVRTKKQGDKEFGDFVKADGLQYKTLDTITHLQYAISLHTKDGTKTPALKNVRVIPGDQLIPENSTEQCADLIVSSAVTTSIHYEH